MPIVDCDAEANIFDVGFISDEEPCLDFLVWVHMMYRRNCLPSLDLSV